MNCLYHGRAGEAFQVCAALELVTECAEDPVRRALFIGLKLVVHPKAELVLPNSSPGLTHAGHMLHDLAIQFGSAAKAGKAELAFGLTLPGSRNHRQIQAGRRREC